MKQRGQCDCCAFTILSLALIFAIWTLSMWGPQTKQPTGPTTAPVTTRSR